MAERRAELERKKVKLEQMRKERLNRNRLMKKEDEVPTAPAPGVPGKSTGQDMDQILQDLGIPATGDSPASVSSASTPSQGSQDGEHASVPVQVITRRSKGKQLSIVKVSETTIAPKELVSYSKETQTTITEQLERDGSPRFGSPRRGSPRYCELEWDDEFFADDDADSMDVTVSSPPAHKMPHVELVRPAQTQEELLLAAQKEEKIQVRQVSEEEKQQIMMREDFQTFFSNTSRIMERALAEDMDILLDYSAGDGQGVNDELAGERLKKTRDFFDERWSKNRTLTSLDWSVQHPELLLASYNANEDSPHDPEGVALIWNVKFKKNTPEYIFHCHSPVTSSCFANFQPNLIVGGTYTGQIVLWDNRVNKRTPVQRTSISAIAHTHPVYCVRMVGTQNAHNLISISTDGKVCSWSLDMLSQPQDSMDLFYRQNKSVPVMSLSFLSGDVNNFVVGSEDCTVYAGCRHGSKAGINEAYEGHQGPVTGIDCHSVQGQIDFSPYFLTSSLDCTIKLWSIKEQKYIHSFEDNTDYVCDVQWSPIHPALFASVDIMGRLDLWNLNNEIEVPTASVQVDTNVVSNHCRWHQSGHVIAAGDDLGSVHMYDVSEQIANPKNDEWTRFRDTLQEMRQLAAEREDTANLTAMTSR